MKQTDFSVVPDYRNTFILLPDDNLIKKHEFNAGPELNENVEEMLQSL